MIAPESKYAQYSLIPHSNRLGVLARGARSETLITFGTVGATGPTAYDREALREPYVAANRASPVGTEFMGKNTLFVPVQDAKANPPSVRHRGPHLAADGVPE